MSTVSERLSRKGSDSRTSSPRVSLNLVHLNLWSVVKLSAVGGVILGLLMIVVALILWNVLNSLGVFDLLSSTASTVGGSASAAPIVSLFSLSRVMTVTTALALIGVITTILGGMIACVLYNSSVPATGGLSVGFSPPE